MIEITRETVAYAIIAIVIVVGSIAVPLYLRRRHRRRLRQRGIKRFGH